jgi:hypothetical protein
MQSSANLFYQCLNRKTQFLLFSRKLEGTVLFPEKGTGNGCCRTCNYHIAE